MAVPRPRSTVTPASSTDIARQVGAGPAVQGVGPGAAAQQVVAAPALEPVGLRAAGEGVGVAVGADRVLDREQRVRARGTVGRAEREVDGDPARRQPPAPRVAAVAAVQRVVAEPAAQQVVAAGTQEGVVPVVAGERVGMVAAAELLDPGERVAAMRAGGGSRGQADRDAAVRVDVARPVDAVAARQSVGAGAAAQNVVAVVAVKVIGPVHTLERVGEVVAEQPIVVGAAPEVGDAPELVPARPARVLRAPLQLQRDHHGRRGRGVARGVNAGAAGDHVVVGTPFQQVVARIGEQRVVAVTAGERVVALAVEDRVGVAPAVQHVVAVTAAQVVDAGAALDDVVTLPAVEHVRPAVAVDVVALLRAQHVLDVADRVEIAVGLVGVARAEVDGHRAEAVHECHRVGAAAAQDLVVAGARKECVVAGCRR